MVNVSITAASTVVTPGVIVPLTVSLTSNDSPPPAFPLLLSWDGAGTFSEASPVHELPAQVKVNWDTAGLPVGSHVLRLNVRGAGKQRTTIRGDVTFRIVDVSTLQGETRATVEAVVHELHRQEDLNNLPAVPVVLRKPGHTATKDLILWMFIRKNTQMLSFPEYQRYIELRLGRPQRLLTATLAPTPRPGTGPGSRLFLPFNGVDGFRKLKAATEEFITLHTGVMSSYEDVLGRLDVEEEANRSGYPVAQSFEALWDEYLQALRGSPEGAKGLPYLAAVRERLADSQLVPGAPPAPEEAHIDYEGIRELKLSQPAFVELIWNYWHEEAMLVQTLNHVSQRFQNVRAPGERNPLTALELDPLRPLNNLLWGYIQDEPHRLSIVRRAHEYEHQYGLLLQGRAVAGVHAADRPSKFLEAFHHLLHQCVLFFRQDDDTTVVADGFPVLNALKETHYLLAQGAHNQFGDLPTTARQEMLMQQWLLARPEMREFLGGRVMVPYPEPWMDRVDTMKTLQGWTDISVVHFRDLAVYGEQLLLTVRYGAWSLTNEPSQAANWARYWRPEIQGYIHAYRAVTGVDLSGEGGDPRRQADWTTPPSILLRDRLAAQRRR